MAYHLKLLIVLFVAGMWIITSVVEPNYFYREAAVVCANVWIVAALVIYKDK
jgi:hypothetical protein